MSGDHEVASHRVDSRGFPYGFDSLCLVGCLSYTLNRWVVQPRVDSVFLHSYFNDLWLIPCALPWVLRLQRGLGLRQHDAPPNWAEVLGHLVVWSVLFEWVAPRVMPVTGDWLDMLAYAAGGLVAWAWWNRPS